MHENASFYSFLLLSRDVTMCIAFIYRVCVLARESFRTEKHNLAMLSTVFPYISTANALLFSRRGELFLLRFNPSNLNALVAQQLLRFGGCAPKVRSREFHPRMKVRNPICFSLHPIEEACSAAVATISFWLSRRERSAEIRGHHIVNAAPYFIPVTKAYLDGHAF